MVSASSILYNFPSLSAAFLIWCLCRFDCCTFSTFHYEHGTFHNAKFHSYIRAVCSYSSFLQFLFLLNKYLHVIHVHKVVNLFLWFCKSTVPYALPKFVTEWYPCYNERQWRVVVFHGSLNDYKSPQISDFHLFQSPFQAFEKHSKSAKQSWCHHHPYVPQLSQFFCFFCKV